MVSENTEKLSKEIGQALQEAVHNELVKKSKLGQYAIISRNGKTCRVLASEIINNQKQ